MNPEPPRVELAARATRDLRRIDGPERRRIRQAIEELMSGAENADIKALAGAAPWLRLGAGDWRVLYRPLTETESVEGGPAFLVARVVHRRDLLRAVRTLDTSGETGALGNADASSELVPMPRPAWRRQTSSG